MEKVSDFGEKFEKENKEEETFEMTLMQLKSIFIAGMQRENENIEIDMGVIKSDGREFSDFGDFMEETFDIKIK